MQVAGKWPKPAPLSKLSCLPAISQRWRGARQQAPDPKTGQEVPIFRPRREVWGRHFRRDGVRVLGLTPTGRATVAALSMNRPLALAIRREEAIRGRHPPSP